MQQVNTEIVYKQTRTLRSTALPNGVGLERLDIIGEVFPLGRMWTINAAISYTMTGVGTVPVLTPDFIDGLDAQFQWGGERSRAVIGCARIAESLLLYLDREPGLIDELWAEGRYKLLTSFGVKFAGGPDDFSG